MTLEAGLIAALVGLAGTLAVELIRYRGTQSQTEHTSQVALEDSQRDLIALLQAELRATRGELTERDKALQECKRELLGLLEQLAQQVRGTVDQIEQKLQTHTQTTPEGGG